MRGTAREAASCHMVVMIPPYGFWTVNTHIDIFATLHDCHDLVCHGLDAGSSNLVRLP
jgi:hypothetical protein